MNTQNFRPRLISMLFFFILSLGLLGYGKYKSGMPMNFFSLNSLIRAIPLVLLYFCIGLILEAWQQHRAGGKSVGLARFLYLTPRISVILIALFISLFALNAFGTPGSF